MVKVELELTVHKYIAKPFTREQKTMIDIQKKSGFNRCKSEVKREQALNAELEKRGITKEAYAEISAKARAPFNMSGGFIVMPSRNFLSFVANTSHVAPRAVATLDAKLVHTVLALDEPGLLTEKTQADDIFSRFVKSEESNERMLAEDPFIANAKMTGTLWIVEEMAKVQDVKRLIEYGGRYVGIGSARSQGFGRFAVSSWIEVPELVSAAAAD